MVLSMPFILAIVGAGVGLLVGILIFGQISDAITCPASGGGGGGGGESESSMVTMSYDNLGSLGSSGDARYYEDITGDGDYADGGFIHEFISATPLIGDGAVYQKGLGTDAVKAEIELDGGASGGTTWKFLYDYGTGADTVSINFWINGDVQGSPIYPLIDTFNADVFDDNGIFLYTRGSNIYLKINERDSFSSIITIVGTNFNLPGNNLPPDDNQWHMITLTYDKSQTTDFARLCIDGSTNCDTIDTGTAFDPGVSTNLDWPLSIGSNHLQSSGESLTENGFDVDDVTIWSGYILDDTDIDNLYNSGAGASSSSINSGSQAGHWTFDSIDANQVEVFSGNPFINTLGLDDSYIDLGDTFEEGNVGQLITLSNQAVVSVTFQGLPNNWRACGGTCELTAKVWSGVTEGSPDKVEVATSNLVDLEQGGTSFFNGTFYFTTQPVLTGDYVVGVHWSADDDDTILRTIEDNVGGNEGFLIGQEEGENWNTNPTGDGVSDLALEIKVGGGGGGGSPEVGSEQCEQAKDTAWTVIGIMPVALFFGLFALFSSFQRPT